MLSVIWAFLSTPCTSTSCCWGLTRRRCERNPFLKFESIESDRFSLSFPFENPNRLWPLLLSAQKADRFTLVTQILVGGENVSLLQPTPVFSSSLPLYFCLSSSTPPPSPSLLPLHQLPPADSFSLFWIHFPHHLTNLHLYFCHIICPLCFLHPSFTCNIFWENKIIKGHTFSYISISPDSLPEHSVSLPSYFPLSSAKHSCSHTWEWELALSVHL